MSADEILAANLWPWPDPLLKRDRAGNIVFVNAAFLQLYGGRAQDWSGRPVSGWPAPVPQGAQRFETRAGEPDSESVYDWVEMVMADGNAMAIARNVTALIAPPPPPRAKDPAPAIQSAPPVPPAPISPPPAPIVAAPAPQAAPALAVKPPAQNETPAPAPEELATQSLEDVLDNSAEDYTYDSAAAPETVSAPTVPAPVQAQAPAAQTPEAEQNDPRMTPRRALPIEDSASVLGSNWRDQVIAKAIGEAAPEAAAPDMAAPETEQTDNAPKPNDGLHILLAEDNAINALLTRTLLEAEGAVVDVVEDGALAVEAVKTTKYDMIFMDMRMPNMDGLESTRKIRAFGFDRPIVALTANAFDDDRNSCFDSGMNDFMTKPVSAEELSEMVDTWVKNGGVAKKIAS